MFLTTLGLAWVLGQQTTTNGVVLAVGAAMLLALGLWGTGLRQRGLKDSVWWPAVLALATAVSGVAFLSGTSSAPEQAEQTAAIPFDEVKLASLRASEKPVFLYFTANWCLTCKVNEKAAIERQETVKAFADAGVVTMAGDWTRGDPVIGRFITVHRRSGVPLYLWYAPGAASPKILPQILTPTILLGIATGSSL